MHQEYDPCDHGMDSACLVCETHQLRAQAEADDAEIGLLQRLLQGVFQWDLGSIREAQAYLETRGLL